MDAIRPGPISFETHPDRYRHWKLSTEGEIAQLMLDVAESGGLREGYALKLNSYDLGVDIELADALQRLRFEHPEVRAVIVKSARDRIFCAGANIYMLGASSHAFKVNFCKFTNETRLGIEDASACSGLKFLCAVNGTCAGGGYELALACDEIHLVDDGNSAVSLPEVPLLGVLPGTGGLTRVVDKRRVRRDHADFFSTLAEGIRGERAVDWKLVDAVHPRSRFDEAIQQRARELARLSDRPTSARGVVLEPLELRCDAQGLHYRHVSLRFNREARIARLTLSTPESAVPATLEALRKEGAAFWPLSAFRELDDALLRLRFNEPDIGTLVIDTKGDADKVLAYDTLLDAHREDWFVREVLLFIKRTLKRLDLTARSILAIVEPGSCFAGTLLELVLAADRSFMLDDPSHSCSLRLSVLNEGSYPMGNGLTRLQSRFYGRDEDLLRVLDRRDETLDARAALELGLVTFAPDDLDWDDEVRLAMEERATLSPDALTAMEANLRFVGPESLETKIFGRLTAWQNWVFQRPNAVGERGALKVYGRAGLRPEFDWERT